MPVRKLVVNVLVLISFVLAACEPTATVIAPSTGVAPTPAVNVVTPTATFVSTVTLPPAKTLVVCIGQEPTSLYLYGGGASKSMWSVLEGIYDGPVDTRKFSAQPVILDKLPAYGDSDVKVEAVDVTAGDLVVDANGDLIALAVGSKVQPAACNGPDCGVAWDGKKALQMNRVSVTFRIKAGILWSDGTALKASDSVYSFKVAADKATPVSKKQIDRTSSYKAVDARTVEWAGVPGERPARLETVFWHPLPEHTWSKYATAELLSVDEVNRRPLGWGPYVVESWTKGSNIRLVKNPNYFRKGEGLPYFDRLVFRFLGLPGDGNLNALLAGECDVIDQTTLLDDQMVTILDLEGKAKLRTYIGLGPEWEHVDLGIRPASYDDGIAAGDRADFFGDKRVRQAFAYCMDRAKVVQTLLYNRSVVPGSYLPPSHPLYAADIVPLYYDPVKGIQLLEQAGWKDADKNPATPRLAQGVANVANGTPLQVTYTTSEAGLRKKTADVLAKSMSECGIGVKVVTTNSGELYAAGPKGVMFGRNFDLVQYAWEAASQPPCFLYESAQIPTAKNNWIGANISGYSSPAYDKACLAARQTSPQTPEYISAHQQVQKLLADELPDIPLYYHLKLAVSRPDMCGVDLDVTARSLLWNVETWKVGFCQ